MGLTRSHVQDNLETLREGLREGDSDAYRSLVRALAEPLYRYVRPGLGDDALGEDVVQQVFVRVFKARERLHTHGNIRTFCFFVATNLMRDALRRRAVRKDRESHAAELAMRDSKIDEAAARVLAAEAWERAKQLPEDLREVILLRFGQGFTAAQAAEVLGIPEGTVKTRQREALEQLRKGLLATAVVLSLTDLGLEAALVGGATSSVSVPTMLTANVEALVMASISARTGVSIAALVLAILSLLGGGAAIYYGSDLWPRAPQPRVITGTEVAQEPAQNTRANAPVEKSVASEETPKPAEQPKPKEPDVSKPVQPPVEKPRQPEPDPVPETPLPSRDGTRRQTDSGAPMTFANQVEESVDRACDWLKAQQLENGLWPEGQNPTYGAGTPHKYEVGRVAFPIWALCSAGCFADDPSIEKGMNWLRKNYEAWAPQPPSPNPSWCTYENACVISAIEAYYIARWEAQNQKLDNPKNRFWRDENGKPLKDASGKPIPIKRWGIGESGANAKKKDRKLVLEPKDRKLAERAVKSLEEAFQKGPYGTGGWRYNNPENNPGPKIDVSATQFALLGFAAASRLGIGYKKDKLLIAYKFLCSEQDKDGKPLVAEERKESGEPARDEKLPKDPDKDPKIRKYEPGAIEKARGWGYCRKDIHSKGDDVSYGGMTCAGICGLTLIHDELDGDPSWTKELDKQCNQNTADGLAWLVANWTVNGNPGRGTYRYYYYLWTLGRAATLGGLDYIDKHDWYYEGAQVMLKQQDEDGGWTNLGNEVEPAHIYNTCYALMFLKRSTTGAKHPLPIFTGDSHDD